MRGRVEVENRGGELTVRGIQREIFRVKELGGRVHRGKVKGGGIGGGENEDDGGMLER